ncbi:fibronectin type III domain protein [Methyloversatilis sp. RAC08]|nr:fibronectin type III domain protein [Methyloversatilis sp. RAC08]
MSNHELHAFERTATGDLWRAKRSTDSSGTASFELDGLGAGRNYILKAQPFGPWVEGSLITAGGTQELRVGKLQVQVFDGMTGLPRSGQTLALKRWSADGAHTWVMSGISDAQGWVKIDPPGVGTERYIVTATSPTVGYEKVSEILLTKGPHRFVLGNDPVVIEMADSLSGSALTGKVVEVWDRSTSEFVIRRTTDGSGHVRLDLDGLLSGRRYVAKSQPYLQQVQAEIASAGVKKLVAGALQVQVVDARNNLPFAWKDVSLQERLPDGSHQGAGVFRTDGEGRVRLDPAGFGSRSYAIRAVSPVDGVSKTSEAYSSPGSYRFMVAQGAVTVRLIDHVTDAGLAGLELHAYERSATGDTWRAKKTTDAQGNASFDLDGLGGGRNYVLKVQPFGFWVESELLTAPRNFGFRVGTLQAQVVDGVTGQGRAGQQVGLKKWSPDGAHTWVMGGKTDASGWIKLDPPNVGTVPYVFTATSPTDGVEKISDVYRSKGPHRFVMGNAPIVAQLRDAVTGAGIAGKLVEIWEVTDNAPVLRLKRTTSESGQASFDVDGLASGRKYFLRTQPYLQTVQSAVINAAGAQLLNAGTLQVQLIDARSGKGLSLRSVSLLEVVSDGALRSAGTFSADVEGRVRLNPEGLGSRRYVLRTTSPIDGTTKTSQTYSAVGSHQFRLAASALTVKLINHVTDAGMPNVELNVFERTPAGDVWRVKRATEGEGTASFDLDGLGEGRNYVVKTQPFGAWVESELITEPRGLGFRVGALQVQVIDGQTGQGRADQAVTLKRWSPDGAHVWVMAGRTDAQGWAKLDPPNVGTVPYVLTATSPTDGREKISDIYRGKGPYRFVLGNDSVVVRVQDSVSGAAISGKNVEVWEKTGATQVLRLTRTTDTAGEVKFDLDGLAEGRRYVLTTKPYLQAVQSAEISSAGSKVIKVGALQVQLIDARNGLPLAWKDVSLQEVLADGSFKGEGAFRTDGEGRVRLDPDRLGSRKFALRAVSPLDGATKTSATYSAAGSYQFKLAQGALTVKLIDHMTEAGVANVELHAYERTAGGDVWRAKRLTDAQGGASFDLDGLGSGRNYVLKTQPFGVWVESDLLTEPRGYGFRVGSVPVTLIDGARGTVLSSVTVIAFEKLPDGALKVAKQGISDGTGLIRFDFEGLGQGREYVMRATNPFADGQDHFSDVLASRGAYRFAMIQGEDEDLDRTLPSIEIMDPVTDSRIAFNGFRISGVADDNVSIREVRLKLSLPSGATIDKSATWRPSSKTWFVETGALPVSSPGTVTIAMTAVDKSWNEATATLSLALIKDVTPPTIRVNSRQSGTQVPTGGFVVSGAVIDDTLGVELTAEVSGGGMVGVSKLVEVAQRTGRWSVVVAPEALLAGGVSVALVARDGGGNESSQTLSLTPVATFSRVWHVLQRTSFGPSPDAYLAASPGGMGVDAWLSAQLVPDEVADDGWVSRAESFGSSVNIATGALRQAAYSDRALREVMTWFWDNHFNTLFNSHHNSLFEQNENNAFRTLAVGRFRDLLAASAKSPAMLYTLDGRHNRMGRPNENYARELMELHTMGVDGGYTERDVAEVARAMTGWTVVDGQFAFDAAGHDVGAKNVLGVVIPAGGGQADGERVLDIVASHPSTARFICRKLVTYFVSDVPVDALVTSCAQTFISQQNAPDQIRQVLMVILSSSAFRGDSHVRAKLKTPLEFVLGSVRQLGGENVGDDIPIELQRQGMPLFLNPVPTGYSDLGSAWLSSSMLHSRARFADRLLAYAPAGAQVQFNLSGLMNDEGFDTAEGVCGRLLERLLGPTFVKRHMDVAMNILTEGGLYPWLPSAPDREVRLRRLAKALLLLPDYQYQ